MRQELAALRSRRGRTHLGAHVVLRAVACRKGTVARDEKK
jgi:hypothetical protein